MKLNNTILSFFFCISFGAFPSDSLSVIKKTLRDSIFTFQVINPQHTAGGPSVLYKLADSLNHISTLDEKLQNFHTTNYILKYYSYITILRESDSLGLLLLKESRNDTTTLSYFQSCMFEEFKLNVQMYENYKLKLRYKYYPAVWNSSNLLPLEYNQKTKNKKLYRRKMKEVERWWKDTTAL